MESAVDEKVLSPIDHYLCKHIRVISAKACNLCRKNSVENLFRIRFYLKNELWAPVFFANKNWIVISISTAFGFSSEVADRVMLAPSIPFIRKTQRLI